MNPALDEPRFNTPTVADVAGVSLGSLRTWLNRGDIPLMPSESKNPGTGHAHRFSQRRVLALALMCNLMRTGVAMKPAAAMALAFTDHNANDGGVAAVL